ncbi:hypothetical protein ABZ383_00670 [Streptomyces sp. NPDC005900]|uniref:hypothetical protein n=1 Tax=Streptomyces sp. NPDC005900 TaxID=3154569 RepID=UPI0033E8426C
MAETTRYTADVVALTPDGCVEETVPGDLNGVTARWTGRGDVAVRIGERGLERGRPNSEQQPDVDPLALVLVYSDTEATLTSTLHCARA